MMETCLPKKPCFKKTFSVPKVKANDDNQQAKQCDDTDSKTDIVKKDVQNRQDSPLKQKEEICSPSFTPEPSTIDDKENSSVSVAPKTTKVKKNLFQAPSADIDVKDVSKEKKKKGTKKKLKVKANEQNDENPKTKKPKKEKDGKENDKVSKVKKPKKEKSQKTQEPKKSGKKKVQKEDKDVSNTNASEVKSDVSADNLKSEQVSEENSSHVPEAHVDEDDVEDKEIAEDENNVDEETEMDLEDEKNQDKPAETDVAEEKENGENVNIPRGLSDEEYQEIFKAVLDRCENTTLEEMYESLKKPDKINKSLVKKEEKTTKTSEKKPSKPKKSKLAGTQKIPINEVAKGEVTNHEAESTDVNDEKLNVVEPLEESKDEPEITPMDEDVEDTTHQECQAIANIIPDEVIIGLESLSRTLEPNFQDVNEETPEGSEVDYNVPCIKTPPPKKNKKVCNLSSNKKNKLAPKQLNFPKTIAEIHVDHEKSLKREEKSSKKCLNLEKSESDCMKLKKEVKDSKKEGKTSKKSLNLGKKEDDVMKVKIDKEKSKAVPVMKEKTRRKELQERLETREILGTWVQCSKKECSKWRYLSDIEDPSSLPDVWTCSMNNDKNYNCCDIDEQEYDEDQHIFTTFAEGSVVWAKMAGFPWWPAMIEIDPDTESYFCLLTEYSMHPSHYHAVFFDDKVSRAWVNAASIKKFTGCEEDKAMTIPTKGVKGYASYKKDLQKAKNNALEAFEMSVQDRLKNFSFAKRYKGTYGKVYLSDSSQETKKAKETQKKKKKKIVDTVDSQLIESVLEESLDNEEEVLTGFEEALDALDEDSDSYIVNGECDSSGDESEDSYKSYRKKTDKRKRQQMNRKKRGDITPKRDIKKPKMFIVSSEDKGDNLLKKDTKKQKLLFDDDDKEDEMVVPSINLDSEIFTMDLGGDNSDENINTAEVSKNLESNKMDTNENVINEKLGSDTEEEMKIDEKVMDNSTTPEKKISTIKDTLDDTLNVNSENTSQATNRSLEQDEQMVPGEDSPSDELYLELSNPVEDKLVIHSIAPPTVELAYDSDPMEFEE